MDDLSIYSPHFGVNMAHYDGLMFPFFRDERIDLRSVDSKKNGIWVNHLENSMRRVRTVIFGDDQLPAEIALQLGRHGKLVIIVTGKYNAAVLDILSDQGNQLVVSDKSYGLTEIGALAFELGKEKRFEVRCLSDPKDNLLTYSQIGAYASRLEVTTGMPMEFQTAAALFPKEQASMFPTYKAFKNNDTYFGISGTTFGEQDWNRIAKTGMRIDFYTDYAKDPKEREYIRRTYSPRFMAGLAKKKVKLTLPMSLYDPNLRNQIARAGAQAGNPIDFAPDPETKETAIDTIGLIDNGGYLHLPSRGAATLDYLSRVSIGLRNPNRLPGGGGKVYDLDVKKELKWYELAALLKTGFGFQYVVQRDATTVSQLDRARGRKA